ncbi:hypothetical protein AXG93_4324s1550 [Marchantia polymorpha subsp. ruderalis]|uniref:C2 domain-containing protein n=1 Tax=Marchantia polymorpha subsp. ruderalis TaxID=1480154 RepID=A0A176W017_MARPO|nr:hypothetical protein AXG93_4324s1550 [Marchantia polymorpha subsp. ruderalis]
MGKLRSGVVSWWDGIVDMGSSASEAFHDFGAAFCVLLAALYALTYKCVGLVLWIAAGFGELFADRWTDIYSSLLSTARALQKVTADLTEVSLNLWDDLMESYEVTVDAIAATFEDLFELGLASLAALGHSAQRLLASLLGSGIVRFEALWEYADTLVVPEVTQAWAGARRRLGLPRAGPGLRQLVTDAQPVLEKLADANHKVVFGMYCAFVLVVWFVLVMSENEGMVTGFLFGLVNGFGMIRFWAWMMARRQAQRTRAQVQAHALAASPPALVAETLSAGKTAGAALEGFEKVIGEDEANRKVERYIPSGETLTSLHLNDLNLGSAAPQIGGVKLRGLHDNKMVMDVRLVWETRALTVGLGVGTTDGVLRVQLENLRVLATVRVQFYFVEQPPFVSVLVLFTPSKLKPVIHYKLSPDQDALEHLQPVVMRKLREFIYDSISDSLHWPNRLVVIPTWAATPTINVDDLQLKPHGQLCVTVLRAENLVNLYPYVLLYIRVRFKVRTKSIENTPNPVWNEEFLLDAEDQASQSLILQVMNEPKGKDALIGVATYPLAKLEPDKDFELELPVQTVEPESDSQDGGTLHVNLRYHVYTKEEQDAAMAAEKRLEEALAAPEAPESYDTAVELLHG